SSLNGGTIILNSGELAIDDSLTISGLGSEQLTIDANEASRVLILMMAMPKPKLMLLSMD
ncbi:MAG: hypothetical protein AAGM29_20155, partial [Cyanobacteria bacterium J06588_4]